jgi:hypothetical protein
MTFNIRQSLVVLTTSAVLSLGTAAMATHGARSGGGQTTRVHPLRPSNLIPGLGGRNQQGMVNPQQGTFPQQQGTFPQQGTIPQQSGVIPQQSPIPTQPAAPLPPQNIPIVPIATAAPAKQPQKPGSLTQQMNDLCVSMHKTYGGMKNFGEAYREAYELLELAKKIDAVIAAGGTAKSVGDQLIEFDDEIEHVQHHIAELTATQGTSNKVAQQGVAKNLTTVGATVDAMLKQAGIDRSIAPPPPPAIVSNKPAVVTVAAVADPSQLVASSKELTQKTNEFCIEMHKTYRDQPEFNEAYREAFELLQSAKQIEKDVAAGSPAKAISEQLANFDSEMHHVENHIQDFAKAQGANNQAGQASVATNFTAVGSSLEKMMGQLGLQRQAEAANRNAAPAGIPVSQMTNTLSERIGSFCNAMDHNFRNNPDFPEAYREAYAVYEISKKVVELSKNNDVNAECKDLLIEIDGEIHHLEEHVDSFKADDKGTGEGSRRAKRKLADVQETLNVLMAQVGIKRKHVE